MKQSMVGALAFGLVGAMMATGGAIAASSDSGQSTEALARKDRQALQVSKKAVKAPQKAAGAAAPGSDRMFNPQPELPDKKARAASTSAPGSDRMFNPQPELPDKKAKAANTSAPGSDRMFNPQPELPDKKAKTTGSAVKVANPGTAKTFNPQPELPDKPAPAGSN